MAPRGPEHLDGLFGAPPAHRRSLRCDVALQHRSGESCAARRPPPAPRACPARRLPPERLREAARVGVAVRLAVLASARMTAPPTWADIRIVLRGRHKWGGEHEGGDLVGCLGLVGHHAREHLIEHGAQPVDVGALVHRPPRSCSGAMYSGVPTGRPVAASVCVAPGCRRNDASRAMPKSVSSALPFADRAGCSRA